MSINPKFITDNKGKKVAIIIPIREYEKIVDELEMLEDIKLYDDAKSENEEYTPLEDYIESRKKKDGQV